MANTDGFGFSIVAGHGAHNGAVQVYGQLVRDCQHTNAVREERLQRNGDVLCKSSNIDLFRSHTIPAYCWTTELRCCQHGHRAHLHESYDM
jgi:hypothetical protein